jgi:hypothetical protein
MATSKLKLQDKIQNAEKLGKTAFDTAKGWVPEEYRTAVAVGAGALGIGLVSYAIGRASKPASLKTQAKEGISEVKEMASQKGNDIDRIFKFVKLWLFYKAVT